MLRELNVVEQRYRAVLEVLSGTPIIEVAERYGPVAHILANGTTVRTLACPIPQPARHRLRGARAATAGPPQLPAPLTVRRRVSVRGAIMIGGQRIQVGLPHAGKTANITIESDAYQITVDDG